MRLKALAVAFALVSASSSAHAQSAPDPLFGDSPHAKAVLDCQSNYALRFAKAMVRTQATPTEIATAAYAHCIGEFNDFAKSLVQEAKSSNNSTIFLDPQKYQAEQIAKMRDYSFARTLDTYLSSTTNF